MPADGIVGNNPGYGDLSDDLSYLFTCTQRLNLHICTHSYAHCLLVD